MKISSEEFTKNGKFQILEKISEKKDSQYIYKLKIKCVDCGEEQIVRATHKERCVCNNCRLKLNNDKYVGKIYGCYLIVSFDHYNSSNTHRYFKVKCLKCGEESIKTLNNIKSNKGSCSNCKKGNGRIPTLEAPRNCVKSSYISGAKDRNLEFSLSDEDFDNLIFGNCYFCDSPIKEYQQDKVYNKTNIPFLRNGIDRLDSSKGYTKDNCVSCCSKCNAMKSDSTEKDFIDQVEKIHNFVNKRSTTSQYDVAPSGCETEGILTDNAEDKDIV